MSKMGTTEDPQVNSGDKFICTICDQTFSFKKMLKKHNQTYHTPWIKCKLCDKTFEKTCDLESHIKVDHDSVETLQCEKCDKNLHWHQDLKSIINLLCLFLYHL